MRVLLINPPTYLTDAAFRRRPDALPIGLGIIARCLRQAGHDVDILDVLAGDLSTAQVEAKLTEAKARGVAAVGVTAMSTQYAYVKWLTGAVRKHMGDVRIVVGGPLAVFNHPLLLDRTDADVAILGEGEPVAADVFAREDLSATPGVAWRRDGQVRTNPLTEPLDLNHAVWPDYQGFPLADYLKHMQFDLGVPQHAGTQRMRYVNVLSGRGCAYACRFCSRQFRGLRLRPVQNVLGEIEMLRGLCEFNTVVFSDELAVGNPHRARELCEAMARTDLLWSCNGRVNSVSPRQLEMMKAAGCYQVTFGIESGSQKILDAMNKRTTREQSRRAIEMVLAAGLHVNVQMIFGYPGEDDQTVEDTVQFFLGLPVNVGFAILTPLPGSELYDQALAAGKIDDEEKYLLALESGFARLRVNFTDWDEDTFYRKREEAALRINTAAAALDRTRTADAIREQHALARRVRLHAWQITDFSEATLAQRLPAEIARQASRTARRPLIVALEQTVHDQLRNAGLPVEHLGHRVADDAECFRHAQELADLCIAYVGGPADAQFEGANLLGCFRFDITRAFKPFYWLQKLCDVSEQAAPIDILLMTASGIFEPAVGELPLLDVRTFGRPAGARQRLRQILHRLARRGDVWGQMAKGILHRARHAAAVLDPPGEDPPLPPDGAAGGRTLFAVTDTGNSNCAEPLAFVLDEMKRRGRAVLVGVDNPFTRDFLAARGHAAALCRAELTDRQVRRVGEIRMLYLHRMLELERRFTRGRVEALCLRLLLTMPLDFLEGVAQRLLWFRRQFERFAPDAAVVFPEQCFCGWAAIEAARARDVPTMMFYQSLIQPHPYYGVNYTDRIAAYGTQAVDALTASGVPRDKLILTGNPKFDKIPQRSAEQDARTVHEELDVPPGRPFALIATHLLERGSAEWVTEAMAAFIDEPMIRWTLVIKPHPDDDPAAYQRLAVRAGFDNAVILEPRAPLYPLLHTAGAVLTGYSTVGLEAALFDKPVIAVNFSGRPHPVRYDEEGIALPAQSPAALRDALRKVIGGDCALDDLARARQRYIERIAWRIDGQSSARFVDAIDQTARLRKANSRSDA